jgi:hypothetical protein
VLVVVTTALAVTTAVASPTPPTAVSVSGTQTVIDESTGTFAMQGSLVGAWNITKFVTHYASDSQYVASGKELFVGCLDDNKNGTCDKKEPAGSLKFTFIYWASFDPASGALIHGQCVHPILGGTGSFHKASGVIFMEDTPVGDSVETTYTGTLAYSAAAPKSGHAASAHARRLAAATSTAGHGGGCGA